MRVTLIGQTTFDSPDHIPWLPDETATQDGAEALSEFAGRACYQAWNRPNPKTAHNIDYLGNIIAQGHESVLEHGSASFYVEGVSRALTHELIRHRQLSFSELSQRYVNVDETPAVPPPNAELLGLGQEVEDNQEDAYHLYREMFAAIYEKLPGELSTRDRRKQAREAARSVLPNATETKLVVTGNHRAWRHVLLMRGSLAADAEIRQLALRLYRMLSGLAPGLYQDIQEDITPQGLRHLVKV